MRLNEMFKKTSYGSLEKKTGEKVPEIPRGLLKRCNACKEAIFTEDVKNNDYICPACGNYFRMHWKDRIRLVADEGSFQPWDQGMEIENPMNYKGYEKKVSQAQAATGLEEAVITGKAMIHGNPTALGVFDSRFIMASMGKIVGEKITRMIERAGEEKIPIVLFVCSGGARMQEGITSLMQMAKTSAALKRFQDHGGLYIPILTNPTTGGVTASFAMEGDIVLAEPGALIGFAGPRVIEQTIGQKLPKGFQSAEFLLDHGFIDRIVSRKEMKRVLALLLEAHKTKGKEVTARRDTMMEKQQIKIEQQKCCTPWERVLRSRDKNRPVASCYIESLFKDFIEFHGDRCFGDDPAVIGGIGNFCGIPVTIIAQEKGTTTKENLRRNFAMVSPEGYRKALRLMKQAEKFHRPVICFVDTPGAFCGIEAEERGQGEAIARNIYEMSGLKVPVLSIIIGEGGSGGALALATADEVWMMENSIYSILSPEGFASILWKDSKRAKEAADVMKLTSEDLKNAGVVEKIIQEPEVFNKETMSGVCESLTNEISGFLFRYGSMEEEILLQHRFEKFRKM